MTNDKEWYRSRTIWGGLIALAGAVAGIAGVRFDAGAGADLASAIPDAAAAIGAVIAIFGRLKAETTIA